MESSNQDTLFIAIPIPERIHKSLAEGMMTYKAYIAHTVPLEKVHITVVWLGKANPIVASLPHLLKPLHQSFVPTITITHLGQGLVKTQLWAYIQATANLAQVHTDLLARSTELSLPLPADSTRPFVPHSTIARFSSSHPPAIPDTPIFAQFPVTTMSIFRSTVTPQGRQYSCEGIIPLQ